MPESSHNGKFKSGKTQSDRIGFVTVLRPVVRLWRVAEITLLNENMSPYRISKVLRFFVVKIASEFSDLRTIAAHIKTTRS